MQNIFLKKSTRIVVFTDLDGTLLDHETYDFAPALPAIARLRKLQIPLVICTSKTAAEIRELRAAIGNTDPFISENGGGVFVPEGYFPFPLSASRTVGDCRVIELGTGYAELSAGLDRLMQITGLKLRGFSMMAASEVASLCDFSPALAALAKQRDYDEPFVLAGQENTAPAAEAKLAAAAAQLGLRITRGGRFFHLTGANDKGRAVLVLRTLFQRHYDAIYTLALGDSANDEPMFRQADAAVLLQKKDGSYDATIKSPVVRSAAPGPAGWNAAVMQMLEARALPLDKSAGDANIDGQTIK